MIAQLLSLTAALALGAEPPVVSRIFPDAGPAGGPAFNLTVEGSGFTPDSTVQWNGSNRPGALHGTTRLVVYVPASDVAIPGTASVRVLAPGIGPSNALPFTIGDGRPPPPTQACAAPANPVVAENCRAGSPSSEWEVASGGDPSISGFAADISYDRGETAVFKIKTDAKAYRVDVYRLGYYGGAGARLIASLAPSARLPQAQPACLEDATGLIDCGNWAPSASWPIPAEATSGVYLARLVREDTGGANHVPFIVRDDAGRSALLFQTSDATWQAYNAYGGNSIYAGRPAGRAYKVSYNRPFANRAALSSNWLFTHEYPMLRWLEANGYDVSYFSGVDSDRHGRLIANHRVLLSVGHDEYWSGPQRAHVEAARAAGVSLAFFSANEIFWKTRWEPSIDGSGTPHRTLVCYKETWDGKTDPADPPTWTGMWRDKSYSPASDGGRPENALTGVMYGMGPVRNDALRVSQEDGRHRFWRGTDVARLPPGGTAVFPELLGYEWDADLDNGWRPAGLMRLSSTTYHAPNIHVSTNYSSGWLTHHLTLYRHGSGAWVFGAGTMQWPWGLDKTHDKGSRLAPDVRLQQATVNLLADMKAQPGSLQPGLAPASPSSDASPPVSRVVAPAPGAALGAGVLAEASGTAADAGGVVAAVEVSTDAGRTWHPAEGRERWSYRWRQAVAGAVDVRSRAVDDSGNLEGAAATAPGLGAAAPAPPPAATSLSPLSVAAGRSAFSLTVEGSGFTSGAVVRFNGADRPGVLHGSTRLIVAIPAADIAAPGTASVAVFAPGAGLSNALPFTIAEAAPDKPSLFALRDHYAFPNPSRRGQPITIRVQAGLEDAVLVKIADAAGAPVAGGSAVSVGPYTYEYVWDPSRTGSGVFFYSVTTKKAGYPEAPKYGRLAVLR